MNKIILLVFIFSYCTELPSQKEKRVKRECRKDIPGLVTIVYQTSENNCKDENHPNRKNKTFGECMKNLDIDVIKLASIVYDDCVNQGNRTN